MSLKESLRLSLLALICLVGSFSSGQTRTDAFVNAKARFALANADQPTEREEKRLSLANCELYGESFVWKDATGNYTEVQQYTVSGAGMTVSHNEKKALLAALKKGFLDAFAKANLTSQESVFTDGGLTGPELRAIGSGRLITRIFFYGERLYVVSFTRRGMTSEELLAEYKTFRILPKDEYVAALVVEHTPKDLPQDSNAKIISSELRNEGLKGKVKEVITERQEGLKGKRERLSESFYDAAGTLLKEVDYMEGYPIEVAVWGWIDGKRVNMFDTIVYDPGEGPNRKEIIVMMEAPGPEPSTPPSKRDGRYSYSYSYRHNDAGELVETTMSQNDGKLWQRIAITRKPGQRETSVYDDGSKLNSRSVEILDPAGNVVEERSYNYKGVLERIVAYKYEFDQQGNWITRREFKKVRGHVLTTPALIEYRTITYY